MFFPISPEYLRSMKHDIFTPEDIRSMVNTFYKKVQHDDLLGPVFNDIAQVQWESHLPVMYTFCENLLLGTARYSSRPLPKQAPLPISTQHLSQWIKLFKATVDILLNYSWVKKPKKPRDVHGPLPWCLWVK